MKLSDRWFVFWGFVCCFGFWGFFYFPPRWKEDLVSTEFLLVWIMLYTELSRDTAGVALRTCMPYGPCPWGSFLLSASSAALAAGAEPVAQGQWSDFGEGLSSAACKSANTLAEFWLASDSPEPWKLRPQPQRNVSQGDYKLQCVVNTPRIPNYFSSSHLAYGEDVLWVNVSACLTGAELTNGGCNISINRGGGEERRNEAVGEDRDIIDASITVWNWSLWRKTSSHRMDLAWPFAPQQAADWSF